MPDPITHISVSFVFARHFFNDHKRMFVLAALSPDIDVAVGGAFILLFRPMPTSLAEFAEKSMIFHPSLTATLWFIPIFAGLLSWGFRKIDQKAAKISFSRIYIVALVGMLFHIGLDMMQPGNRPLWPLDVTAGFDLLPISPVGRIWTMLGAISFLILDWIAFSDSGRFRIGRRH